MIEFDRFSDIKISNNLVNVLIKIIECKLDSVCLGLYKIRLNPNDFYISPAKYKKKDGFRIKFKAYDEQRNYIHTLVKENGGTVDFEKEFFD